MIAVCSEKDIPETMDARIVRFIIQWLHQLNDDDPQMNTYFSDFPIGSLGDVWIAERSDEVMEKEFMELIQVNQEKKPILFIGTWIPMDGTPCADIFVPASFLSRDEVHQWMEKTDQSIEVDSTSI